MNKNLSTVIGYCLLLLMLPACSGTKQKEEPFFVNGFRNGWATSTPLLSGANGRSLFWRQRSGETLLVSKI